MNKILLLVCVGGLLCGGYLQNIPLMIASAVACLFVSMME